MGKVSYGQSGYVGRSMSVRATRAYDDGLMPRSKWTKRAMVAAWEEYADDENLDTRGMLDPNVLTVKDLRQFLKWHGWHHTGKYARQTDFYGFDAETFAATGWQDLNQSRHDEDDLPYLTVVTPDGRRVDGGVYGHRFVSDTSEQYRLAQVTPVACPLTPSEQDSLRYRAQEAAWRDWQETCRARGEYAVDQRHADTTPAGPVRAPEPVLREAVRQYWDEHGMLPDSVAAFRNEHPELVRECCRVMDHAPVVSLGGFLYQAGELGRRRVKNMSAYPSSRIDHVDWLLIPVRSHEDGNFYENNGLWKHELHHWRDGSVQHVMGGQHYGAKWIARDFLDMPQIRVQPAIRDTSDTLADILDEQWEPLYLH